MDCQFLRVAVLVVVMASAGILGSHCRKIWEKDEAARTAEKVIFPGLAAAFVIPLFLSIGDSSIMNELLKDGGKFWESLFIVAGFCIIAGVSAPSFVNALAQKALNTAEEAKAQAERVENKAEAVSEAMENKDAGVPAEAASVASASTSYTENTPEWKTLQTFRGSFKRRTIGGIVKDSGLKRASVEQALRRLQEDAVVESRPSPHSGVTFYELK